jgi:hypothetical protein
MNAPVSRHPTRSKTCYETPLGLVAPHPHPASSGGWPSSSCPSTREQWRAAAVGSLFLPLVLVVPCFHPASSCSRRRLGVPSWSWCQLIPAVRRPTLHPASRGSQRWCGRRGCRLVFHQLEVAMWQEVLTSCLSHFPGLPDTSYAVSHPICIGRRGWDSPCCQKVVVT